MKNFLMVINQALNNLPILIVYLYTAVSLFAFITDITEGFDIYTAAENAIFYPLFFIQGYDL